MGRDEIFPSPKKYTVLLVSVTSVKKRKKKNRYILKSIKNDIKNAIRLVSKNDSLVIFP